MNDDMYDFLFEAAFVGPSQAIENQEKRGQQAIANSTTLPKRFNYCKKEQFESMGIVFGEEVDELFIKATLPKGWSKRATDHSLHTDLVDDKGRKRASIFYKAAFYDRDAFISLKGRFSYSVDPISGWNNARTSSWHCVVTDGGQIIWQSETLLESEPDDKKLWREWYDRKGKLGELGLNWLNENYPDWRNPLSYWE